MLPRHYVKAKIWNSTLNHHLAILVKITMVKIVYNFDKGCVVGQVAELNGSQIRPAIWEIMGGINASS